MRRKKSTAEKQLSGTYKPERDKATPRFDSITGAAIKPPTWLRSNKIALQEWKAVAPFLEAEGILKPTDVSSLASYCVLYSRWREAALDVEKNGQTIIVTSTTRTGRTDKPVVNPAVRNEVVYAAAMLKAATKLGLNPLDRPRVDAAPAPDEEEDKFERFLRGDNI